MLIVLLKFKDLYAGVLTLQTEQKRYFGKENFAKVRYFAETLSMVLHKKHLREQLKIERPLDEETGTMARKNFVSRVRHEVNRASRENQNLMLMMVAFDDEAGLLNRYGKAKMMKLMQATARLIVANMRNYDLIARFDNYRFAICLINISEVNARQWADKIRQQILNSPFETGEEYQTILASVSVGLAELRLSNPDIDQLFEGAKTALEHALKTGNSVKVF
jgi:diguanylate cyclase (GGDEF)-like protein